MQYYQIIHLRPGQHAPIVPVTCSNHAVSIIQPQSLYICGLHPLHNAACCNTCSTAQGQLGLVDCLSPRGTQEAIFFGEQCPFHTPNPACNHPHTFCADASVEKKILPSGALFVIVVTLCCLTVAHLSVVVVADVVAVAALFPPSSKLLWPSAQLKHFLICQPIYQLPNDHTGILAWGNAAYMRTPRSEFCQPCGHKAVKCALLPL